MKDSLKFIIPGKPEYLTMVRLAISSIATTAGFDLDDAEDIKNAVEEACKNISCHGFDGFSDKYEVDCHVEQGRMEIQVTDCCDEHTLTKIAKPCQDCPKEGDLGIFVINSLMNEVEIVPQADGHKSIRMVKSK
ncbi:MAG TPA: ATP-binding protein [Anaerovoracaceae bacterium]|nr:ATP-binding protein [Anaerovoracaceae bacterium]